MSVSPLLVYNNTNLAVPSSNITNLPIKNKGKWVSKQRRCFHRLKSGEKRSKAEKKQLRFLTLTSKKDVKQRRINDDFQILKKRIKRLTIVGLVRDGYIKTNQIIKYFPHKGLRDNLEFEYCKVETSEGGGVLHIIFKGDFIPQRWISDNWKEIRNGSWNVDIRLCRDTHACYAINQYLSGQNAFERYSWSWGWVYKGFVKNWYLFKDHYMTFQIALNKWDIHLQGRVIKWSSFVELAPDGTFIGYTQTELNVEEYYPDSYLPDTSILALSIEKYRKENGLLCGD